jgi:hypothetical protein
VASGLALVLTVVPFVLLLLVGGAPLLMIPGALFTALFIGLLVTAVVRARSTGRQIEPAIDGAWVAAATDIARSSREPLTAPTLSQKLGIDEAQADELLALLDVHEAIGGPQSAGPRARIEVMAEPARAAPEPAAALAHAAEAEAAEGDAAAAQRKKL